MTEQEANAECQSRWGLSGAVRHRPEITGPYMVGFTRRDLVGAFEARGWGDSWEEAFAKAEKQPAPLPTVH
jgi:hypothetical protein